LGEKVVATLTAFFVRKVTNNAFSTVRLMVPSAAIMANSEFVRVTLDTHTKFREQELMELSSRLETDVMWLSYHSVTDGFKYYHWQAGKLLRGLVYGDPEERTWGRIEGQPEAWEQSTFFDPEFLAFLLEDEGETPEEKRQLEQFWQKGELVLGRMEPYLSAQDCAFSVVSYYRFPGWDK
jgi:hypothetical protein